MEERSTRGDVPQGCRCLDRGVGNGGSSAQDELELALTCCIYWSLFWWMR